jgi:DNA-binding CsgD family transcriptional regulator
VDSLWILVPDSGPTLIGTRYPQCERRWNTSGSGLRVIPAISDRQREGLILLLHGATAKQIAAAYNFYQEVEFHKANITRKLDVHTTSELIKFVLAHGPTTS